MGPAPGIHQTDVRWLRLLFDKVPARYRTLAKEAFCAFMAMPLPPGEERPSLISMRMLFGELRRFFVWLDQRPAPPTLAELSGEDVLAYARHVRALVHSESSVTRFQAGPRGSGNATLSASADLLVTRGGHAGQDVGGAPASAVEVRHPAVARGLRRRR